MHMNDLQAEHLKFVFLSLFRGQRKQRFFPGLSVSTDVLGISWPQRVRARIVRAFKYFVP